MLVLSGFVVCFWRMGEVVVACGGKGMEVRLETEEEPNKMNQQKDDGSEEMIKWDKFLPQMVLRVLLVEADDSTRQIIAALLRKCSYRGIFLISFIVIDDGCFLPMRYLIYFFPLTLLFVAFLFRYYLWHCIYFSSLNNVELLFKVTKIFFFVLVSLKPYYEDTGQKGKKKW